MKITQTLIFSLFPILTRQLKCTPSLINPLLLHRVCELPTQMRSLFIFLVTLK
ncbi:hypothetical protein [Cyanobacterium sp. Dongsha4]|uniref:hypothetical protein n=1 Tax=Cyanobacterium sp. DS4 TaxID=2878255 RepID=UPI002E8054F5|nr:hypothetical protein [Cyanobacterium sp. Dongsha4]WVL00994.1 hypothetical protein Dongsha4_02010 [Cyanobacterium sp. Dongsha4]